MDDEAHRESVGYRRPPRHSRFRKGQSGNPSGRRKGSGIRSALEKVLDRKVTVTVDGERLKVPLTEALVLQLVQKAAAGDARSIREVLKIADQMAAASPVKPEGKRLVIERRIIDPKDCNPALDLLGIVVPVDGRYRVAPWAVEAAMARKPRLSEADRVLISNSTLKPGEKRREIWDPVVERPRGVVLPGQ
jgi:hypothetical protein